MLPPLALDDGLLERLRFDATPRGLHRVRLEGALDIVAGAGRHHVERARAELRQFLEGTRAYFTVPLDLGDLAPFQASVLDAALRIPFGRVDSYAAIARRVGRPRAARAVGNALAANPVPPFIPCHRVVRDDGTWGHHALGGAFKTAVLALERATPPLSGCVTTGIVCWRGCPHERRIRTDRRVPFASLAEARRAGYRACRTCRPGEPVAITIPHTPRPGGKRP